MDYSSPPDLKALLENADWVRTLALRLAKDPHEADDLEQDTWLRAFRRPPRSGADPRNWLATVMRNALRLRRRSDHRRAAREHAAAREEQVESTEAAVEREALKRRLAEAVLRLPEQQRDAVILRYFDGLSPPEIAARRGVPIDTVRTRLRRARSSLRRMLRSEQRGGRVWAGLTLAAAKKGSPWAAHLKLLGAASAAAIILAGFVMLAQRGTIEPVPGGGLYADEATEHLAGEEWEEIPPTPGALAPASLQSSASRVSVAQANNEARGARSNDGMTIRGRVTSGPTSTPVADAVVRLSGTQAVVRTGTDGGYVVRGVRPGERLAVRITAAGFLPWVELFRVGDPAPSRAVVNAELRQFARVSGIVIGVDGATASGARVARSPSELLDARSAKADVAGRFRLSLPASPHGPTRIHAALDNAVGVSDEIYIADGEDVSEVIVRLQPGGEVVGHAAGWGERATVFLKSRDDQARVRPVPVEEDGRFRFSGVPAGQYQCGVVNGGRRSQTVPVAVEPPRTTHVVVPSRVADGVIECRVVDDQGEPVPGAHVSLRTVSPTAGPSGQVAGGATNATGGFRATGLVDAEFRATVSKPGFVPVLNQEVPLNRPTTFKLPRAPRVRGRVLASSGEPASRFRIRASRLDDDGRVIRCYGGSRVFSNGHFDVPLNAGAWRWQDEERLQIVAFTDDGEVGKSAPMLLRRGVSPGEVTVNLQPGLELVGVVEDPNGAPLPGATVEAVAEARSVTTSLAGSFQLNSVPRGRLRLRVQHRDWVAVEQDVTCLGQGTSVRVRMSNQGGAIRLTVQYPDGQPVVGAHVVGPSPHRRLYHLLHERRRATGSTESWGAFYKSLLTTDTLGEWTREFLAPRSHRLVVRVPGHVDEVVSVSVKAGETTRRSVVVWPRQATGDGEINRR